MHMSLPPGALNRARNASHAIGRFPPRDSMCILPPQREGCIPLTLATNVVPTSGWAAAAAHESPDHGLELVGFTATMAAHRRKVRTLHGAVGGGKRGVNDS